MGSILGFVGWAVITLMLSAAALLAIDSPALASMAMLPLAALGGLQTVRAYFAVVGPIADEARAASHLLLVPLRVGGAMMITVGSVVVMSTATRAGRVGIALIVVGLVLAVSPLRAVRRHVASSTGAAVRPLPREGLLR